MMGDDDGFFGRLAVVADPLRGRILLALEQYEMTVSELCVVFQLPQSTMSRHLKALGDEGWVGHRVEGTSRWYGMVMGRLAPESREVWEVIRREVSSGVGWRQDRERIRAVLAERRARRQEFFSTAAGEWDRLRVELIGSRLDAVALLGLLNEGWRVGDLGCGTGRMAELLAPFVSRVVAVDESPEMLAAARARLAGVENVEVRSGALETLPLEDEALDAVVAVLVFAYVVEPVVVLREAVRVLRPGGRLLIADLTPHDREEYRQRLGHLALGFTAEQVSAWAMAGGVRDFRYTILAADNEAKGPALFVATGRTPD